MYPTRTLHNCICTAAALRPAVQVMLMISTWCINRRKMGNVHGTGVVTMANNGQMLFVMLVGRAKQFEAHLSKFFCGYQLIGYACLQVSQMPRC